MSTPDQTPDLTALAREALAAAQAENAPHSTLKIRALRFLRLWVKMSTGDTGAASLGRLMPYVDAAIAETEQATKRDTQAAEVDQLRQHVTELETAAGQFDEKWETQRGLLADAQKALRDSLDAKAKWRRQAETAAEMIEALRAELAALRAELAAATERHRQAYELKVADLARETERVGVLANVLAEDNHSPDGFHAMDGPKACRQCVALRKALRPAPAATDTAGQDGAVWTADELAAIKTRAEKRATALALLVDHGDACNCGGDRFVRDEGWNPAHAHGPKCPAAPDGGEQAGQEDGR